MVRLVMTALGASIVTASLWAAAGRLWWLALERVSFDLPARPPGLVALLALACAVVGVATYIALQGFLLSSLDKQLALANTRYIGCVLRPTTQEGDGETGGKPAPKPPNPARGCAQQQGGDAVSAQLSGGNVRKAYPTDWEPPPPTRREHGAIMAMPARGNTAGIPAHSGPVREPPLRRPPGGRGGVFAVLVLPP